LRHPGLSVLDIVSPCVTFNDFPSSTKGWEWAKNHEEPLHEIGLVRQLPEIEVEQKEGETTRVQMHDGTWIVLRALRHGEHKVTDKGSALRLLIEAQERNEFLTGLVYVAPDRPDFVSMQEMTDMPLALLPDESLRPSRETLAKIMETI
jgi:2-oxoglutarate ferredoxin oxidoreductase subunit beta